MEKNLSPEQREKVEAHGWIHSSIIIEVQGNEKTHVKTSLENLVAKLEKEKGIDICSKSYEEARELGKGIYSCSVEIVLITRDFGRLIHVALLYSPSSLEIYTPKEIKFHIGEAQNALIDISNIVTTLAQTVFIQDGRIRQLQRLLQKEPKT